MSESIFITQIGKSIVGVVDDNGDNDDEPISISDSLLVVVESIVLSFFCYFV